MKRFNNGIEENREIIFSVLFYVAGLFLASVIYKCAKAQFASFFEEILSSGNYSFLEIFLSRLLLYSALLLTVIIFGISVLGFGLINIIPFLIGFSAALKICYYYSFSFKGILSALLLCIPEVSLFVTLLIYCVKNSSQLSSIIYKSIKNSDTTADINLGSYLKITSVYALLIAFTALINSVLSHFLSGVITL